MTNIDSCPICKIIQQAHDKAVCFDLCSKKIHMKQNNLNDLGYGNLKLRNETWCSKECIQEILPFCRSKVNPKNINSEHSSIDPTLKFFLCHLNNLSEQKNIINGNLPNCKYRDVSYFLNTDVKLKLKCLPLFHLSINSLPQNFDDFNHLINDLNLDFDISGLSELKIFKSQPLNINISLQNYVTQQISTEPFINKSL